MRLKWTPLWLMTLSVAGFLFAAAPAYAGDTGIKGVVLWGPVKSGPESIGQDDEAPLSATFDVYSADQKTAQFLSDRTGAFEISLPPGDYVIVPDKKTPIPYAQRQKTKVTVPADGYVAITIRLDTGRK